MDVAEIERACTRLIIAYSHLVDLGHAEDVAELFAPDGVFQATPEIGLSGQDEIRAVFSAAQEGGGIGRHICTNIAIDVVDEDRATGFTYVTVYRKDPPVSSPIPMTLPSLIGHYRDDFVRLPDGWRFQHRECGMSHVDQGSGYES